MSISQQVIAERLGLSTATISRSLSGHPKISPKTRARVLSTAIAMGYSVEDGLADDSQIVSSVLIEEGNEKAGLGQNRRGGRRRNIKNSPGGQADQPAGDSMVTPSITISALAYGKPSISGYASLVRNRILSGMIEECRQRKLTLSLDYIDEQDADRLSDPSVLPPAISSGLCHGALISGRFPDRVISGLSDQLPCVKVADYSPSSRIDCIDHDDTQSVEILVSHLWSLGHRKIGFVGSDGGHLVDMVRGNAYYLSMLRRGFTRQELSSLCCEVTGPLDQAEAAFGWAREAMTQSGVTAWIATNDAVGYKFIKYLADHGISCPEDVSVCGFDHFDPPAGLPQLTSIDAPFEDMGRLAVTRLFHLIRQTVSSTYHTMFECDLCVGQSTRKVSVSVS